MSLSTFYNCYHIIRGLRHVFKHFRLNNNFYFFNNLLTTFIMEGVSAFAAYSKKICKLRKDFKEANGKIKKSKPKLTDSALRKLKRKNKKKHIQEKHVAKNGSPQSNSNKTEAEKPKDISTSKLISHKKIQQVSVTNNQPKGYANTEQFSAKESIGENSGIGSIDEGIKVFNWLISPISKVTFFEKFWEKKPCFIQRNNTQYFSKLISFKMIDEMLVQNHIEYTKNIDITSYKNGVRETHNPEGRAVPPEVWSFYSEGCSIRMLNPQTYLHEIFKMNATLQELFHCMVGANFYLTPPNSQGFAPHFDDIEAFVLQIEGKKRWKLYESRTEDEILPRFSSKNFNEKEIGKPIFEKVLHPGDVLYFPRGVIHQACTEPGYHSLHITLSVYQRQSFADLFELLFPMALSKAISENVKLREGIPLNFWRNVGMVHSNETSSSERENILKKCRKLVTECLDHLPIDEAADQMAKKFQHDALPPAINNVDLNHSMFGSRNFLNDEGEVCTKFELDLTTNIRLLRANIIRLVLEDDQVRIYYYVDNSREYHEYEPNFIEIDKGDVNGVETLIRRYPQYISIKNLPLKNDEKKITLAQSLWERGLIITKETSN